MNGWDLKWINTKRKGLKNSSKISSPFFILVVFLFLFIPMYEGGNGEILVCQIVFYETRYENEKID